MSFIDFVDTQRVEFRNITDGITYTAAQQIRANFEAQLTRRQLTDDTFENLWDLLHGTFEGDIMVTEPEIAALMALLTQTNNAPPTKTWRITMISDAVNTTFIEGTAQLESFRFVDEGIGSMRYHLKLAFTSVTVTTT